MPASADDARRSAGRSRPAPSTARASGRARESRERRLEEVRASDVRDVRDLDQAAEDRAAPRARPSRPSSASSRSAMWCSGPGKPTSVSSLLAGRRVGRHVGVVQVAALELARLRARARRGTCGRSSGTCRSRSGTRRRSRARRAPCASRRAASSMREDLVLGEEARERRDAGQREAADDACSANVNGIALRKPPILSRSWTPAIARDHRAGGHEQQRLEEGVRHQVEHAARRRPPRRRP